MTNDRRKSISVLLNTCARDFDIPGLAAAVCSSQKTLFIEVHGKTRVTGGRKLVFHDKFLLNSNTKAMTATMIASLVEEGVLSWHSVLADIFPEFLPDVHKDFRNVTLRQLLTHTAGTQPFTYDEENDVLPKWNGSDRQNRLDFARYLLCKEPFEKPGEKFVYSNAGYAVAVFAQMHLRGLRGIDIVRDKSAAGWVVEQIGDIKISWHNGWSGVFCSQMIVFPKMDYCVVVAS